MTNKYLEELYEIENYHWWFVGTRKIIFSYLKQFVPSKNLKILDIGCGLGINLLKLKEYGKPIGLDYSYETLNLSLKRGASHLICSDARHIPFKDNIFDLVTAFDVLEHIDEDDNVLKEIYRVCKNGGFFLMTIPAYKFLWSGHDEALKHKRRYTKKVILRKLKNVNLKPIKISYFNTLFFSPILLFRLLNKFILKNKVGDHTYKVPKLLNQVLLHIYKIESFFLKYFNFPFGVSIICLSKK
jgi:SAM-dependent methyltransferase